jgi:hypothetical protein
MRTLSLFLLAALTLAVGACGGEDEADGPTAPPAPLSEAEFTAAADAACEAGAERATELPLPGSRREVEADAEAMGEIVRDVREQISALGAPEGREAEVEAYLAELTEDIALLGEIRAAAAEGGDFREPLRRLDESAGQAASELGLDECAGFANVVARTP